MMPSNSFYEKKNNVDWIKDFRRKVKVQILFIEVPGVSRVKINPFKIFILVVLG
jgi:hypothetical protein